MPKTPGDKKRERIFDTFATNLDLLREIGPFPFKSPKNDLEYICPLCFKGYDKSGLSKKFADHLTLEDVPPQSLGGKVRLLTCKICNNEHGSQLDKHLKEQMLTRDFLSGIPNVKRKARFEVDETWNIGGTIENTEQGGFKLLAIEGNSHEKHYQKMFKEGNIDLNKINFTVSGEYIKRQAQIAKLRIAYLWLVSNFGYASLYNSKMHIVRKQILEPNKKILNAFTIGDIDFPPEHEGVSIITEPKELRAFAVAFNLKTDQGNRKFVVLLPGPSDPGLSVYKEIERLGEARERINFNLTNLDLSNTLTDRNRVFDYFNYWNGLN